jgi:hypothetical protein
MSLPGAARLAAVRRAAAQRVAVLLVAVRLAVVQRVAVLLVAVRLAVEVLQAEGQRVAARPSRHSSRAQAHLRRLPQASGRRGDLMP